MKIRLLRLDDLTRHYTRYQFRDRGRARAFAGPGLHLQKVFGPHVQPSLGQQAQTNGVGENVKFLAVPTGASPLKLALSPHEIDSLERGEGKEQRGAYGEERGARYQLSQVVQRHLHAEYGDAQRSEDGVVERHGGEEEAEYGEEEGAGEEAKLAAVGQRVDAGAQRIPLLATEESGKGDHSGELNLKESGCVDVKAVNVKSQKRKNI